MPERFDVVVVGGGHAGCEAAAAAARMGAITALVTHRLSTIGAMSCNPAIGGLGKVTLCVSRRLDGLMGRVADSAGIQFRLLNRRRDRQCADRVPSQTGSFTLRPCNKRFGRPGSSRWCKRKSNNLTFQAGLITGVELWDGRKLRAGAIVITTGTFLRGLIHIGERQIPAGRVGEEPCTGMAATLEGLGFALGRLKTGTPPRLDGRTIEWAAVEMQPGDDPPEPFSALTEGVSNPQVQWETRTSAATHRLVRDNVHRSPMYSGQIASRGPRYCPSIEDKIVRFGDRDGHQIFLEPEGLDDPTVYPNGISTPCRKRSSAPWLFPSPASNGRACAYGQLCHRI